MADFSSFFQTEANVYRDSFYSPVNSANMNPGWGMDPALLTPSYDAPYRPSYGGPNPYQMQGRPGFFNSAYRVFGPTKVPYWGNPVDNAEPYVQSMATKPMDAAAWTAQNVLLPYYGFKAADAMLGPGGKTMGQMFSRAMAGRGAAAGLGYGLARGAAQGIGLGATLGRSAGAIGGLAGYAMLPFAAAMSGVEVANSALIDPYTNTRRTAQNLRQNFSNIYFPDAQGHAITGKGLGHREASRMGYDIVRAGNRDMMFSGEDYSDISDMASRAGLMDNVTSQKIVQRVKDVSSQIKLVVAISKDPDIRKAIEEIAKLNQAGADVTGGRQSLAATTLARIGGLAAASGASVQKVMNTVGAQGQYLFQSSGMTPYLGQLAAASSYAGFAAAERTGVLSRAQLARMGGVEGATQASLTAQLGAAQTPLNEMAVLNKYIYGNTGRGAAGQNLNLIETVSQFGQNVSNDPLAAMGSRILYGRQAAGKELGEAGALNTERTITSILENLPVAKGSDGKYDPEHAASVLAAMGIPADQIMAWMSERATQTDSTVAQQNIRSQMGFAKEQNRQFVSQHNLGGGWWDTTVRTAKRGWRSAREIATDTFISPITDIQGQMGDFITRADEYWSYGRTLGPDVRVKEGDLTGRTDTPINLVNMNTDRYLNEETRKRSPYLKNRPGLGPFEYDRSSDLTVAVGAINELALRGTGDSKQRAIDYLNASSSEARLKAAEALAASDGSALGDRASRFLSGEGSLAKQRENLDQLERHRSRRGTTEYTPGAENDRVEEIRKLTDKIQANSRSVGLTSKSGGLFGLFQEEAKYKVGSSDLGNLETFKLSGEVAELVDRMYSKDPAQRLSSAELMREIGSNDRYAYLKTELDQLTKNMSGKDREKFTLQYLEKNYASSLGGDTGQSILGLSRAIQAQGLKKEDIDKMSEADKTKLLESTSLNKNAGFIVTEGLKSAYDATMDQRRDFDQTNRDVNANIQNIVNAYTEGKIRFSDLQDKIGRIDRGTADTYVADKMHSAVDKFSEAVDKMPGVKYPGMPGNDRIQNFIDSFTNRAKPGVEPNLKAQTIRAGSVQPSALPPSPHMRNPY